MPGDYWKDAGTALEDAFPEVDDDDNDCNDCNDDKTGDDSKD